MLKAQIKVTKGNTTTKYRKPKITKKKLNISFFLTNTTQSDTLGFLFGNIVQAQSSGNPVDDAFGESGSDSSNCTF